MSGYVLGSSPSTQADRVESFWIQTTDDSRDLNASQDTDTYYVSGVVRAFGPVNAVLLFFN